MTQLRRDPIIGQWVIVHTEDSWGPDKYDKEDNTPTHRATCQFCPGREHMTPPEVDAVRSNGSHPNSSDWKVRVVPNKFPALVLWGQDNSATNYWNYIKTGSGNKSNRDPYHFIDGGACGTGYQIITINGHKGEILSALLIPEAGAVWQPGGPAQYQVFLISSAYGSMSMTRP